MTLSLTSSSFFHQDLIPAQHTCDGEDHSPELVWTGTPKNAKSLVVIVDDPDAPDPQTPRMTWVHWILYNIPPDINKLSERLTTDKLPAGTLEGINDWGRVGYGGPCPPIGTHRYFHKLYALDTLLPDLNKPTKAVLEQAMQDHVIAQTELIGLYRCASNR